MQNEKDFPHILLAISVALVVLLAGCSSSPAEKTPEQIQAETQSEIAANNAKLETDPVAIKCRQYSGTAYDGARRGLCQHLKMNPRVADASVDPDSGEYDPTLDVLLRPGVTASQTRALAFRIRDYMTAHYSGDRALIVREINIHHQASENANIAALSRVTGGKLGMVGAIVQNGVEDTDTRSDPAWHIEIDRKQVR